MRLLTTLLILTLMSTLSLAQTPRKSEHVSVNGKQLYYEVYGNGKPLIMLHGYSLSSTHWKPYVEDFSTDHEVYLIDLTGHGKSEAFKEELSIASVADDLSQLIKEIGIESMDAIGFSFGGDVLYQLALLEPELINSMITIGAIGTWDVNDFPQYLDSYTFENIDQFEWMRSSHSSDEQIKTIMEQFKNYTVLVSDEQLKTIKPEVMIMLGDDDIGIELEEVARVRKHLPKSDLWVLPNVPHGAHEGENKPDFIKIAKAFLSKE
ncbi:alpha/beta fold hydrolase [Roseivirga sp. E12]|uniref:alpha/beta fold hydrolase n=1 Tax=Roseivirga sp. E12 TaxID=2819237 RepID=UPI001ABC33C7|nr:alpha/beta hydrolase [Roseivirga sp. E12]MBO3697449.1 alpha/beta hydrolase [Roseivirga sp. E12]